MLLRDKLSKSFLSEVANIVVYMINKSSFFGFNCKTTMEVWNGKLANYDNIKIFDTLAFAHIKKDKLEAQTGRCIFVVYVEGMKGYKLWKLELGKSRCFITKDIIFNETRMVIVCIDLE